MKDPRLAELAEWSTKSMDVRIMMRTTFDLGGATSASHVLDIVADAFDELYTDAATVWADFGEDPL